MEIAAFTCGAKDAARFSKIHQRANFKGTSRGYTAGANGDIYLFSLVFMFTLLKFNKTTLFY